VQTTGAVIYLLIFQGKSYHLENTTVAKPNISMSIFTNVRIVTMDERVINGHVWSSWSSLAVLLHIFPLSV
jgi:hypothetical protein